MFSRSPLKNSLQTRGASLSFTASKTPSKRLLAGPPRSGFKLASRQPHQLNSKGQDRESITLRYSAENSKLGLRHLAQIQKRKGPLSPITAY